MDTAIRQGKIVGTTPIEDWIIGFTNSGRPVFRISGGDGTEGEGDDGGQGGDDGDAGDGGDGEGKEFKPVTTQDDLDRIITKRIARERAKVADYADLKKDAEEFRKLQEGQKSELQKATDRAARAEAQASDATLTALRLEVALEKGLTAVQAKRLVGKTKEELEADADELVASFKSDDGNGGGSTRAAGMPKERLRGGGDPTTDVEPNPEELAKNWSLG
jgi:hypothetical protein